MLTDQKRRGIWLCVAMCVPCMPARAVTPAFSNSVQTGTVQTNAITEASGLAASRRNPHVLWVHNDSGSPANLFALNPRGAVHGTYGITGAGATDWEDIAICRDPDDGLDYLYIGDIGDNLASRPSITVYRVLEPDVDTNQFNVVTNLPVSEIFTMNYPDGARDAETLMVDPFNGDIYIISKLDNPSRIYRAAYPQDTNMPIVLVLRGQLAFPVAVAGDVAPSGREALVKTPISVHYYSRDPGDLLSDALTNTFSLLPYTFEPQGEAIAWQGREKGYYTLSEGLSQPIYYYASSDTDDDGLVDSQEVAWNTDLNEADSDADGQSDGDEVVAGVSPTNPAVFFAIASVRTTTDVITVEWAARTNRLYDVQTSMGHLSNGTAYITIASNLTVTMNRVLTTNVPAVATHGVQRLRVRRTSEW